MASTPAMQGKAVSLAVVAILAIALRARLRRGGLLSARDERWQPIDIAAALGRGDTLLRPRHVRLRLIAWRKGLSIARDVGLLAGPVRCLCGHVGGRILAVVVAITITIVVALVPGAGDLRLLTGKVRVVLAELLLRGSNQTEIMFGVLKVVFRRDRIAGGLGVAGELHVLFSNVGGVPTNFHFRSVGLVHARHRVVIFTMIIVVVTMAVAVTVVVVTTAHALVVLTVSHDLPVCNPQLSRHAAAWFNEAFQLTQRATPSARIPAFKSRRQFAAP
jgi:hypothetical protein